MEPESPEVREDYESIIRDYDPKWPDKFLVLASRIKEVLGPLVLQVEHIGSTAVPGLAAKAVIDLDVVLESPFDLPEAIRRLGVLGYTHEGDLGIAGREAFRCPSGEARHHLYVLIAGATELRRHMAFRDALRADLAVRDTYAALKRSLVRLYPNDPKSYTDAKSYFIAQIVGGYDMS